MKVLVIGSGGREHGIVWKLAQSSQIEQIYCAPGNDGLGMTARVVPIKVEDLEGLLNWAIGHEIDLTIVGPEVPLSLGIVDLFTEAGLKIFGPDRSAAMLEGSKAFAKDLLDKYNIPTASYKIFTDPVEAKKYITEQGVPLVIKADGLAAGKGVLVATELNEALQVVEEMMEQQVFGSAGSRIVVEEFLQGVEMSLLALTDGHTVLPMTPAHDHKTVFDGDQGPNTGGMGVFSPSHLVDEEMVEKIKETILQPTIDALKAEGIIYKGVLYAGLMLTESGPKVLEFNVRFGDPETQAVLPRLENDLIDLCLAVVDERLDEIRLSWNPQKAVTVILASGGYPLAYEKGKEIKGLDSTGQLDTEDVIIFHAGTRFVDGQWLTNGGRVLAVTALGKDFAQAQKLAYQAVERIEFADMHYRQDIGSKAL